MDYDPDEAMQPTFHLKVFKLADKYCISALKDTADFHFWFAMSRVISKPLDSDLGQYGLAVNALYEMDATLNACLRKGLIPLITNGWDQWSADKTRLAVLEGVMRSAPADLAADLVIALSTNTAKDKVSEDSASVDGSDDADEMSDS